VKKDQPPDKLSPWPEIEPEKHPLPPPTQVAESTPRLRGQPPPASGLDAENRKPKEEVVGSGDGLDVFQPEAVQIALPVMFKLNNLEQAPGREKLAGELKKDRAFRLELPCTDGTRAFGRLQAVLQAQHTALLTDPVAQDRLGKPRLKTSFVIYAEDLTPEELTGLLREIGRQDREAAVRPPADRRFSGDLIVTRLSALDHKQLTELVGVDPTRVAAPATARPPEHSVLALAFSPLRSRPGSAEIKRFLASRTPARSGTVSILLVLRDTRD
jgi:hypothetical protein